MIEAMVIPMTVSVNEALTMSISAPTAVSMRLGGCVNMGTTVEHYEGATEVTPSSVTQVLETADKMLTRNITVNPIPSNYGLITWNGGILTVS